MKFTTQLYPKIAPVTANRPASARLSAVATAGRLPATYTTSGDTTAVIRAKLADFQDRFGITSEEVNPAYTSQTCSCCGYVDKRNRRSQSTFTCLWCGSTMHADVNAARDIGQLRALSIGSAFQSKASVLAELVRQFRERRVRSTRSGGRSSTADPRSTNPCFGGEQAITARMSGQTKAPNLVLSTLT